MQKVYLLLRNNQQTGPYSFEELLELHLKPHDLIWVEGKSYGWRYPTEVESLKAYVAAPETPLPETYQPEAKAFAKPEPSSAQVLPPRPKTIFVSMPVNASQRAQPAATPVDPIEQKAEELRKRVQSFTPQQEPVKTNYARDLHQAEEEYTQWIYQKKTKKKTVVNKKSIAIAAVCILLAYGGWWLGTKKYIDQPAVITENKTSPKEIKKAELAATTEPEIAKDNSTLPPLTSSSTARTTPGKEKQKMPGNARKNPTQKRETFIARETVQNDPVEKTTAGITQEEKKEEVIAVSPVENKKTLKEKISELFRKRKADEPSSETGNGATENTTNGRKATHRNEENEGSPVLVDVSSEIEIKTNKIADSWMMGVKGLKLTLHNRSNLTINAAKLEVLYYSEQNNLLEKKILSYSNIPPKKSQTMAAPDQRLADHIEYKVISATGIENAYANK